MAAIQVEKHHKNANFEQHTIPGVAGVGEVAEIVGGR